MGRAFKTAVARPAVAARDDAGRTTGGPPSERSWRNSGAERKIDDPSGDAMLERLVAVDCARFDSRAAQWHGRNSPSSRFGRR